MKNPTLSIDHRGAIVAKRCKFLEKVIIKSSKYPEQISDLFIFLTSSTKFLTDLKLLELWTFNIPVVVKSATSPSQEISKFSINSLNF